MENYSYTCSSIPNYYYTYYSDTFVDNDWDKHHGTYDNQPWWGILPPPTYYDLKNIKTTSNCKYTLSNNDLYDENLKLKEKISKLENILSNISEEIKKRV